VGRRRRGRSRGPTSTVRRVVRGFKIPVRLRYQGKEGSTYTFKVSGNLNALRRRAKIIEYALKRKYGKADVTVSGSTLKVKV